jgi:polysaccharide biosynthesis/export protein
MVVVMAGLSVALAAQTPPAGPKIAPHDALKITVWDQPTLQGSFLVGADGTIQFPMIGLVKVGGLTAREAEAELTKRLADGYLKNPQVTVEVQQQDNKTVIVTGEVRAPGVYHYAGQINLLTALTQAGSTADAAGDEVLVIHPGGQGVSTTAGVPDDAVHVNLDALLKGSLKDNITLEDGDTVLVPKAVPALVTGYVRNPGPYEVGRGVTIERLIAMAGGLTELGSKNRVTITRIVKGKPTIVKDVKSTTIVKPGDTVDIGRRIM